MLVTVPTRAAGLVGRVFDCLVVLRELDVFLGL